MGNGKPSLLRRESVDAGREPEVGLCDSPRTMGGQGKGNPVVADGDIGVMRLLLREFAHTVDELEGPHEVLQDIALSDSVRLFLQPESSLRCDMTCCSESFGGISYSLQGRPTR